METSQSPIQKILITGAALIIFAAIIYVFLNSGSPDTHNWQTYHNDQFGFEFKYPTGTSTPVGENAVQIALPVEPNTTLSEKRIETLISEPDCPIFDAAQKDASIGAVFNGITFIKDHGLDAATSQRYESTRYTALHDGFCVGINFVLHWGVWSGVAENPPPDFNRARETAIFDQIISTFRFTK